MKTLNALIFALVLGCTALAYGQSTAKTTPRSFGSVANGIYTNKSPRFEMRVPEGWVQMNQEQQDQALARGSEALKAQTGANAKEIDEGVETETIVLQYAKKPVGSIGNSTMVVGIGRQPAGITGKMVSEGTKELLLNSGANKIVQDIKVETIGGKPFASMIVDMTVNGGVIRMKHYSTVVGTYSITVAMVASDDESLKAMEDSLHSINFTSR